jgi:hypothetical protein
LIQPLLTLDLEPESPVNYFNISGSTFPDQSYARDTTQTRQTWPCHHGGHTLPGCLGLKKAHSVEWLKSFRLESESTVNRLMRKTQLLARTVAVGLEEWKTRKIQRK